MALIEKLRIVRRRLAVPTNRRKAARKWRKMNRHNFTCISAADFPFEKVHVGNYTYGPLNVKSFGPEDGNLLIGHFCSIGENVVFLLGGEHSYKNMTTYPFRRKFFGGHDAKSKGDIAVEDDVWLGYGSIVRSGVTLARGTVVAAGSVVVKSTEPYSIVGGNPARLIKKRFSDETIGKLMKIDFSAWDESYVKDHIDELYTALE